jgi:enolase-phosphatase E1
LTKAILTDIEGTTSSIDFVHQTLFPYARAHLRKFLAVHGHEPAVRRELAEVSHAEGRELTPEAAAEVLEKWIAEDRKATPLKALQGMIWRQGYESGELKGHVYDDTPEFLRRCHDRGLRLYVYSSGSVDAQKLIFAHTAFGDLTPLFSGYFDTRVGGKREAQSYRTILRDTGLSGPDMLFLSDVVEELDAARAAGMKTCQLLRDDKTRPATTHPHAHTFSEVHI